MIRAYSVADVRAAEASETDRQPQGELMARAATGLTDVVLNRLGHDGDRVVVLVGSGDNGGDALYAAGHLAQADANVLAVLVGRSQHEGGLEYARTRGVSVLEWRAGEADSQVLSALAEADVVIDGIAGIGGRPGLPEHLRELPDHIADTAYVLAVDLPSGCDPAGLVTGPSIYADETVTFSMAKPVHLLPATEYAVGLLNVVDIGVRLPKVPVVERLTREDVLGLWPVPGPHDDKYSRGVLGVVAGGETYTGAAVMAVTAAVTAGIGMVRYVGPPAPTDLLRSRVPEAVFGDGRCQAWAIGSGWEMDSADPQQLSVARAALASSLPVVLDAGGLDLIDEPRDAPTLLTPHAGELGRLAERLGIPTGGGGVALAQRVADHLQATVLLKGAVTTVVPPSDAGLPLRSQADAPAWLATAGAGDVLAGICGALLAGGLSPLDAGSLAALVHGVAAEDANPGGPVRAMDVAHQVGGTVARLLHTPTA
ncbi:bifunctional ADP-dependent NAD(P)H-hydrate dehydratase/NAD(P)H-hydrate epimerase [Leekyejoonella antrihumi]|uniref:ADP-dependent (S)-NAD(P)H-hydrate dehydratase n=1 Tax=Leekyejoonella antrihumi TaxID=1660198 RepID=A0A563E1D2_9MICO|nr:bifunctional ADP-dependent NAD(P)H-hydrate dehydratase/NAD(P)H-hydrate epimerase [Leekyejoonella antrihumi]TWP36179.1 bifunctional ADP-dependent NAD(P)H-hydrate dehydratase/NAD(P)H-hydrate epimerase [Leekyejoonella antrihumi]